jgi:hypothetical protein
MEADSDLNVALRDVTVDWPRRESPESVTIAVRYSDMRGIARYEQELVVRLIRGKLPNDAVQLDHDDRPHWRRLR